MVARTQRGAVADWMRTVDPWLLGAFGGLMAFGVVMALAASPAVAERLGLPTFHFVDRQAELLPRLAQSLPRARRRLRRRLLGRRLGLLGFAHSQPPPSSCLDSFESG